MKTREDKIRDIFDSFTNSYGRTPDNFDEFCKIFFMPRPVAPSPKGTVMSSRAKERPACATMKRKKNTEEK